MKEYAIIVAGGSGSRMKSKTPKQFLLLADKPILMHTINAFRLYSESLSVILVLPQQVIKIWESLCEAYGFDDDVKIIVGGESRFQSVKNGLEAVDLEDSLVAIHDGVRPLVRPEIIDASFKLSKIHGSAVASTRLKESLRQVYKNHTKSIDRSQYRSIQTPQTFRTELIKAAYAHASENLDFTDDASVAERHGVKISLFEGSYENIKITTPEDLLFAEAVIQAKK